MRVIESTISGFLVASNHKILFFKKNGNTFELRSEYETEEQASSTIFLSPQEDMLAFYSKQR